MIIGIGLIVKERSARLRRTGAECEWTLQADRSWGTTWLCSTTSEVGEAAPGERTVRSMPADHQLTPAARSLPSPYLQSGGGPTSGAARTCSIRRALEQAAQPGSEHNLTTQALRAHIQTQHPTRWARENFGNNKTDIIRLGK